MFNVVPLNLKNINVTKIESGIARKIIIALLEFLKKIKMTSVAKNAPRIASWFKPLIDCLIYKL
jgi:hypothetical protein